MYVSRCFSGLALALVATAFITLAPEALAASKLYDMNPLLGQQNPMAAPAAPRSVQQPTPAGQSASPGQFGSQLYDMDRMLNERNPFDTSAGQQPSINAQRRPIETAQSAVTSVPATPSAREVAQAPATPASSGADPTFPDLDDMGPDGNAVDVDGRDPLEPINRVIFGFNELVYKYLLTPVARGYNKAVPEIVRDSLSRAISNLNGPVILANDLLQGEFKRAGTTTTRFVLNSTLGFLGTQDVASDLGFAKHSEDFGQTMGAWGVGEGFYLVLPLLGPSNPRDAIGKFLVDGYFDPLGYHLDDTDNKNWGYVRSGVGGFVDYTEIVDDLDNLRETSVDFYGALRSLYRQRREAEIRNREQGAVPSLGGGR